MAWEENKHPRAKNGQFASKGFDDDNDFENWDDARPNETKLLNMEIDEETLRDMAARYLGEDKLQRLAEINDIDDVEYLSADELLRSMSDDEIADMMRINDFDADEETDFELTKDSKDESEAISGYDKTLKTVDNPHMKEQIEKIRDEEVAHKEYLDKAKTDPNATYEEPLDLSQTKHPYFKDFKPETVDVEQLVTDNSLNDEDALNYGEERGWDIEHPNDWKYDPEKNKDVIYAVRRNGKLILGDGRHRVKALNNSGHKKVKILVKDE